MDEITKISFVEEVDTRYLEALIGYNSRRASLAIIGVFLERMAKYDLRPVDFSVLSLVEAVKKPRLIAIFVSA
jgi:hypothetical protein